MIYNLNARRTTDGEIFVQYMEDGKAKDKAFLTWNAFVNWMETKIASNS